MAFLIRLDSLLRERKRRRPVARTAISPAAHIAPIFLISHFAQDTHRGEYTLSLTSSRMMFPCLRSDDGSSSEASDLATSTNSVHKYEAEASFTKQHFSAQQLSDMPLDHVIAYARGRPNFFTIVSTLTLFCFVSIFQHFKCFSSSIVLCL